MRKYVALLLMIAFIFCACACGDEQVEVEPTATPHFFESASALVAATYGEGATATLAGGVMRVDITGAIDDYAVFFQNIGTLKNELEYTMNAGNLEAKRTVVHFPDGELNIFAKKDTDKATLISMLKLNSGVIAGDFIREEYLKYFDHDIDAYATLNDSFEQVSLRDSWKAFVEKICGDNAHANEYSYTTDTMEMTIKFDSVADYNEFALDVLAMAVRAGISKEDGQIREVTALTIITEKGEAKVTRSEMATFGVSLSSTIPEVAELVGFID